MKFLTLNTHSYLEKEPLKKLDILANFIVQNNVDVICLQEVNQSIEAKNRTFPRFQPAIPASQSEVIVPLKADNFALLLVEKLETLGTLYSFSWVANHIGYARYDEGAAILAKEAFEASSLLVSRENEYDCFQTRKIITAKFPFGLVSSCHFSWWENGFKGEWNKVETAYGNQPAFFFGDFNNEATLPNEGIAYLKQRSPQLVDMYEKAEKKTGEATVVGSIDGWKENAKAKRIDFGFCRKNVTVLEANVVFDGEEWQPVSDHYGVFFEVKIE